MAQSGPPHCYLKFSPLRLHPQAHHVRRGKVLPAPLKAYELTQNSTARIVGYVLLCCSVFLAVVHFVRMMAILLDNNYQTWKSIYDGCGPTEDGEEICSRWQRHYDDIHVSHAVFEGVTATTLLLLIPPSALAGNVLLPMFTVVCNSVMLFVLMVLSSLKLSLYKRAPGSSDPDEVKGQFGFLVFCLIFDLCSCCCLIILAGVVSYYGEDVQPAQPTEQTMAQSQPLTQNAILPIEQDPNQPIIQNSQENYDQPESKNPKQDPTARKDLAEATKHEGKSKRHYRPKSKRS